MKKTILIWILFTCLFSVNCEAQTEENLHSGFVLNGQVTGMDDDTIKLELDYHPSSLANAYDTRSDIAVVKNGRFTLALDSIPYLGYIRLSLGSDKGFRLFSGVPLLVSPGDKVDMHFDNGQAVFTGVGAAKLNYMIEASKIHQEFFEHPMPKMSDYLVSVRYMKRRNDSIMINQLRLLESFKGKIDNESYEILKLDAKCYPRTALLTTLAGWFSNFDVKDFVAKHHSYFTDIHSEARRPDRSWCYTEFLLKTEMLNNLLNGKKSKAIDKETVGRIEEVYKGAVRDKLLAMIFSSTSSIIQLGDDVQRIRENVLKTMTTAEYKKIVKDSGSNLSVGRPIFDFHLYDTSGHLVNLSDYRGKVVFLEFYFRGCSGCANLSAAMTPVVDYFKGNPNVVFININTDKRKDDFIDAVKSGKFSHPGSVNVYTNGLGNDHEMLKYYGFTGYPHMLLADKNGDVLYENPPRPRTKQNGDPDPEDKYVLKLIDIINKGLDRKYP